MSRLTTPTFKVNKLWHIDLDTLRQAGVTTVLLDMDNTVVPWHCAQVPPKAVAWIHKAKQEGFRLYLLSNNLHARVAPLAQQLEIISVANACKPWKRGLRTLQKRYNVDIPHSVMIGDQIFTDILAGNLWGTKTILVDPLLKREGRMTWLARTMERIIMKRSIQYGEEDQ